MDFYAMLDQIIDLLRHRQRVAYRALKVQFHLDEEALEALKDELIEAQQLARDEHNRILVWTGSADPSPAPPPSAADRAPQPTLPQTHPPSAALFTPDAERRQLTVLFGRVPDYCG